MTSKAAFFWVRYIKKIFFVSQTLQQEGASVSVTVSYLPKSCSTTAPAVHHEEMWTQHTCKPNGTLQQSSLRWAVSAAKKPTCSSWLKSMLCAISPFFNELSMLHSFDIFNQPDWATQMCAGIKTFVDLHTSSWSSISNRSTCAFKRKPLWMEISNTNVHIDGEFMHSIFGEEIYSQTVLCHPLNLLCLSLGTRQRFNCRVSSTISMRTVLAGAYRALNLKQQLLCGSLSAKAQWKAVGRNTTIACPAIARHTGMTAHTVQSFTACDMHTKPCSTQKKNQSIL